MLSDSKERLARALARFWRSTIPGDYYSHPTRVLAAQALRSVLLGLLVWLALYLAVLVPLSTVKKPAVIALCLALFLSTVSSLFYLHRGRAWLAGWILLATFWLLQTLLILFAGGISHPAVAGVFAVTVTVCWLLEEKFVIPGAGLFVGVILIMALLENAGVHLPAHLLSPPVISWATLCLAVAITAFSLSPVLRTLNQTLARTKQQAAFNQAVLDSLTANVAVIDAKGVIIAINQAWEQFACENDGDRYETYCRGASYLEACEQAAATGDSLAQQALEGIRAVQSGARDRFDMEYPCDSPTESRWFEMHATPLGDGSGALVVSHESITERKLAEGEVRRSEAFIRTITDLVPSRIAYVDAKQCYRFVNRGYEEWFAKPRAEIVGKHLKDLLEESLYQRICPYIEEALSGKKLTYVLDLDARDGTERQLNILYVPHFGERREVLGFFASLEDITERKHIEEALRESEERYRAVVQNLGEGVATIDEEERCLMANPAAERIFSVPPGGLVGRRVTEFIPPAEAPKLQLETAKRRLGEKSTYELAIVRQDGAQRTLLVTAAPRFDEEDRFLWTVAVFRDVTEGRSAEEALRLANAYNRSLIEASVDPLVTIEPDGRITDVNKATEEATGYSRSHLIGTDFSDYFTEPEKAQEGYQLVFRDGLVRDYALELRHRDGSVKSVLYNASTYRDEAGQVAGVFAEARDITERKRAEEELRDLNANLEQRVLARTRELEDARRAALSMMQDADFQRSRTEEALKKLSESTESLVMLWQAVENSPAVVVITDTKANIQYVNPKFVEVTGYSAQEAIGENPRLLKSGVHPTEFYKHLWSTITAGKTWFGEFCNRKKNGELYWETASISPVRSVDGQVRQFLAIKEDVTELKRTSEGLRHAKESADEASGAKSAFLASMSHEIRTPLNAILGYAQLMLRDHSLGAPSRENLRVISRSGEHLLALINDVLEVSKIEAGRVGLEPAEFDLHALLRDLASMFVLRTTVKGVGFEVIEAEGLPRYVIADEGKTRQVLANLLSNAVKFTNEGRITVRAAVNETETGQLLLAVEVEDTGAGIAPEEMGKLFRYFEQTRSGREAQGGTGLGLVISRDYARRMGGDISVASELGKGSVFRFEMPIALGMGTPSPSLAETRRVVGLAAGQPPLRVLLADDDETNRGWLSALLESVGFEVREAANGQEAVDIWQAWKPGLVLMDMRMSVMDGYEATRRIRESPGGDTTVIIALTASTFEERMPVIMQAGVNDLVSKPFKENELFDAIGAHLGVSYLYEDAEASAQAGAREPLEAVSLAGLPAELLGRMRQAILSWDMDSFIQILPQVAEEDASVAVSLRRLADDYDYDALARVLEAPE